MSTLNLQCRCGNVTLEVTGDPVVQFYCHCDDCQVVHGAAYVPESVYRSDQVKVTTGAPSQWKLKRNPRFTCTECGTRLFIDVLAAGLRGVNGYLLPDGGFTAAFHVNCDFAVRPIRDELAHFRRMPPMFRGTDEKVDW